MEVSIGAPSTLPIVPGVQRPARTFPAIQATQTSLACEDISNLPLSVGRVFVPPFAAVDYRRYATECVRLAQRVDDPLDKARLLDMAETFRELAEKTDEQKPGGT